MNHLGSGFANWKKVTPLNSTHKINMVDQDFNYFKKSLKLARENTGKYLSETHSTNYKGKNGYIWGYKFLKTRITKSNTHNI